ncbi:MAG: hypothetical protein ACYT04_48510 [Nostoc sp.]
MVCLLESEDKAGDRLKPLVVILCMIAIALLPFQPQLHLSTMVAIAINFSLVRGAKLKR